MIKTNLFLFLIIASSFFNNGFSQGCPNADFETSTFNNWVGYTGTCCGINTPNMGIAPGQHTIMTGPGFDPFSCSPMTVVAPGSTFSAMLGNAQGGALAERLQYVFNVTPTSNLIIFKYAVVLQDPSHSIPDQPRFEAQLYDQAGVPIPCTFYQVTASAGVPGFESCGQIRSKNWTNVGVDVTAYMGQTVTLDVATGDCSLGGHFGYAYVDAGCSALSIEARYCEESAGLTATLTAPDGFANYVWSDSLTNVTLGSGQVITIPNDTAATILCTITSVNGCVATLSTQITPSEVYTSFVGNDVCNNETVLLSNTTTYLNAVFDSLVWTASDGFTTDSIGFSHQFAGPGQYTVTLVAESDAGCVDTFTNVVNVYDIPNASFGFADVCIGASALLNATSTTLGLNDTLTNTWYVNNDTLVGNSVNYNFPNPGTYSILLQTESNHNCVDTTSLSIIVNNNPTANFSITEQCINDSVVFTNTTQNVSAITSFNWIYNNSVINNNANFNYVFNNAGTNSITLIAEDDFGNGVICDDTLTLTFFVHDNPVLAYTADSIVCEDIPFVFTNQTTVSTNETLSYTWESGGATIGTNQDLAYTMNTPGSYQITMTATSSFGCEMDTVFNLDVKQTPVEPVLSVTTPDCPGDPIFLTATAEPFSTISWVGPNNFSSNQFDVMMPIMPNGMGAYIAFVVSEFGCISDTSSIVATIANIGDLNDFDFPNVITANGDNTNDILDVKSYFSSCDEYTLYIFNRWGHLIFEQGQDTDQFQGKDMKGNEISDGVLFYKLLFKNYEKSGYIHLIR